MKEKYSDRREHELSEEISSRNQATRMNLEFECLHCHKLLAIDEKWGGHEVNCPSCNASFVPREVIATQEHRKRKESHGTKPEREFAKPTTDPDEFGTAEWKRYFEGKSIEEREKIKQLLKAKVQEESEKWGKAVLVVIVSLAVLFTVLFTCVGRQSADKEIKGIDQKHEIAEDIEEGKPEKRLSREADDLGEWGRKKYGMFPPSDDEVVRDLLRGYKKGEDVPMPSPERRKEIDKMIEDIFK